MSRPPRVADNVRPDPDLWTMWRTKGFCGDGEVVSFCPNHTQKGNRHVVRLPFAHPQHCTPDMKVAGKPKDNKQGHEKGSNASNCCALGG